MSKTIKESILSKSIKDISFAKDVLTTLPGKLFNDDDNMSTIFTVLKRNAVTSSEPLSQQAVSAKIEELLDRSKKEPDEVTQTLQYLDKLYMVDVDNNDKGLNKEIEKYVKTELSKHALGKFLSENKQDDSDNLNELIDELKQIEIKDISGTGGTFIDFFNDVDKKKELLNTISQNKFSTGYHALDREIEGGIARGEVGVFIAPTGKGKSFFASNLARNYVKQGLNVLYVALEELENRLILRAEQQFAGIDKKTLLTEDMHLNEDLFNGIQDVYKRDGHMFGDYYISKHQPNEVTIGNIEQLIINTTIKKNKTIDVVVIDYPKLMRNQFDKYYDASESGGKMFEEIRSLAQKYDFVCWTLAQTNRTAYSAEVITSEHVEGSRKILNTVEVALVLNQSSEEFKEGFMRLYLDKVRNGTRTGDPFVHLKVEPEKMRIRDETEDELLEHKALLSDSDSNQDKSRFEKTENKRENLNNKFGGIPIG